MVRWLSCRDHDGAIQFEEFLEIGKRYPLALFPLFKYQIGVRMATLGQDAWLKVKNHVDFMFEQGMGPSGAAGPA